ncbi:MAG: SMP-30/gluconolactonase/LRE family protein, partial [Kiritimatiellia bacterium]
MRKLVAFGALQWWCITLILVARPDFGIAAQDGSQIRFTVPPSAVKVAEGTKISFSVSKPTDVEVAILDNKGRVLRHLAAGRLGGEKPPPTPLKPGLVQEIVWDGKDDRAEPVSESSTPLRVRVRAGLKPTFERFLGACPENQGTPVGLACDTKGHLYVVSTWAAPNQHYPGAEIKCFDREGRYLRQVLPFSSRLPPESVTGLRWIELADGSRVPVVWHGANHCVYPQFGVSGLQSLVIRSDGKLALPNDPMGDEPNGFEDTTRTVLLLGSDGSVGLDYLRPKIVRKEWRGGCHIMIAVSPDGKVIYAAGYRNRGVPVPVVTRTTWEASGEPEIFLGSGSVDGATPEGLQEPRGLAVDARGNLYVCDNAAGKVLIFSPDGKRIGQIAVSYPDQIAVHRKTGRIYVFTVKPDPARNRGSNWVQDHNWKDGKSLLRFEGIGATTPSAAVALPSSPAKTSFCLDDSEPVTVIWIAHVQYGKTDIIRVAETENGFTKPEYPIRDRVAPGAVPVGYLDMAADPLSGDLYVGKLALKRYSGITGDYLGTLQLESHKRMISPEWGEMTFSADGSTILFESHRGLFRYDRTGKPAPWPGRSGGDLAPHEVAV